MKTFLTILVTTIVVLFGMQNFDHVPIYYFGGKPVQIRLIFVLALTTAFGYLLRYIVGIHREEELKKKYQKALLILQRRIQRGEAYDDVDDI